MSDRRRVKITSDVDSARPEVVRGATVTLPRSEARALVEAGLAEYARTPKPTPEA